MLARIKRNEKVILWICLTFSIVLLAFFGFGWHLGSNLRSYLLVLALSAMVFAAWTKLGFQKDSHFLRGAVTRSLIVIIVIYGIITFTLGLFLGFNKGYFSLNIQKNLVGFVPTLLMAVAIELLRYLISSTRVHNLRSVVLFTTLSCLMYILIELNATRLDGAETIFIFICSTVLPIAAREVLCSFLAFRIGLLPAMLYKLVFVLYPYLLPIVPDLGDYIHAVANILLPFIIYLVTLRYLQIYDNDKKQLRALSFRLVSIPILALAIILTILVSGIFHYQLIAIGSDSMKPLYARGDSVIFEKVNASKIIKDDILVFSREGKIITHRVVSIAQRNNTLYFTTRGDNNEKPDAFETSSDQVLGRVVLVGKYIGFPTLLLNEIFNQG